jgi:hypothetical protein
MSVVVAVQQNPVIVTLVDKPSDQTNFADVIIGAFGITGVLLLVAAILGAIVAFGLVKWHQRHRPEEDHLPPVTS